MESGKAIVVVVDDDRDVLEMVEAMLADEPYEVRTFRSAAEADNAIKTFDPDFMLIDLMMEEVDAGANLVTKLREKGVTAPAYMLSSVGDELNRSTDFTALGLDGVIQKPIRKATLLAILEARMK